MITTGFYLDTRRLKAGGVAPLKISISKDRRMAYVSTGVSLLPSQWDAASSVVVNHPQAWMVMAEVARVRADVEQKLAALVESGRARSLSATQLKQAVTGKVDFSSTFAAVARRFIAMKRTPGTVRVYEHTLSRLSQFDPKWESLTFEAMNFAWLTRFEAWLAQTAVKNARNVHLRNIRAVFNFALAEELTSAYPFRRFKIRPEATRKRSLSVDDLRELMSMEVEDYARLYRDMFVLSFMLLGINMVDLHRLREVTCDGRVEFRRAKTHRLYSVKVEPEAMAIIERWRGRSGLLCVADRWSDHRNFGNQMNAALRAIGAPRRGLGGRKVRSLSRWPGLTTYWARHTWATVAASLDVPKDTIAAALGHGGNTVTDIYIDFDRRKVDEANRRVLDWVLYGRR